MSVTGRVNDADRDHVSRLDRRPAACERRWSIRTPCRESTNSLEGGPDGWFTLAASRYRPMLGDRWEGAIARERLGAPLAVAFEAGRVGGTKLVVDGICLVTGGPRDKLQSCDSHDKAGGRKDIRLQDVRADDGKAQQRVDRFAVTRVENMLAFLVGARGGDSQSAGQHHAGDLVPLHRMPHSHPPGAAFRVPASRLDVSTRVDEEIAVAVAVENRTCTVDRPPLDQP